MRFVELAGILTGLFEGEIPPGSWLSHYDPDAYEGRGTTAWSDDPAQAIVFASPAEALTFYRQHSTRRPWRADGKLNRPLMSCTVSVERLPSEDTATMEIWEADHHID